MKLNVFKANNQLDIVPVQLNHIKQNMLSGRRQYIIVPDKFSLSMEREIMEGLNLQASMDFEVLTFARFANLMMDKHSGQHILSSLGATMVVQMLLEEHKTKLKCFNKSRRGINLASVIFDSISQLRACNISAQDIKGALPNIQNKLLQTKLSDIALIMENYEKYLGTQYIDSASRMQVLCKAIQTSVDICDVDVHFCHFDNMTPKAMDIVSTLIRYAHSVSIGVIVPDAKQNNAFLYDSAMLNDVLFVARQNGITPNIFDAPNTLGEVQKHLVNNLMANDYDVLAIKQPCVMAWVAGNVYNEIQKTAMDIAYKIKNGARYNQIVVNCAGLEGYAPIIRKVFDDYEIPYWIDQGFKFGDSQLIKFVKATFNLINNHYAREDILVYLKNSLTGLTIDQQVLCERIINKYGIQYDMLFSHLNTNEQDYDTYKTIIDQTFGYVKNFENQIKQSTNIGQYTEAFMEYLSAMQIEQKLENAAQFNREQNDLYNESINRQVYERLCQCIDNMYDIMAEYQTDFEGFCSILSSGIDTITISPLPMAIDCVYVGQNLQSVFSSVSYLYILGANETDFPAIVGDVGIISDMDISLLKDNHINLTPTITTVNMQSMLNTVQNTIVFEKELHISYVLQASDGQHNPSNIIQSLQNILSYNNQPLPIININEFLRSNLAFVNEQNKLLYMWGNLHNALSNVIVESNNPEKQISTPLLATAIKVLKQRGYGEVLDNIQTFSQVYKQAECLDANVLDGKAHLGVTELERYFLCPYMHYVDYVLKLKQNETNDLASLDNGNIIHAVLEKYILYYNKHQDIDDKKLAAIIKAIFEDVVNSEEFLKFSQNNKNAFALKKLCAECIRTAQAITYQLAHSQYKVKYVEKSFGSPDFVPVPEVVVLNQKIKIRGKVDRLDEWKGKYRIVDYKTSKNAGKFSILDLYLGKKIQLFYYMYAILEGLKKKGENVSAGGVYYLPIHREYTTDAQAQVYDGYRLEGLTVAELENVIATDDTLQPNSLTSRVIDISFGNGLFDGNVTSRSNKLCTDIELNQILNYTNKLVYQAICEIVSGYISPKPLTKACEYCKYQNICKINCANIQQERGTNYKVEIKTFKDIK